MILPTPSSTLFPYTTLFRSLAHKKTVVISWVLLTIAGIMAAGPASRALNQKFSVPNKEGWETNEAIAAKYHGDRKSTRLNSSHVEISYAVFCLKKKKNLNVRCRAERTARWAGSPRGLQALRR